MAATFTLKSLPTGPVVLSFEELASPCPPTPPALESPLFQSGPMMLTLQPGSNPLLAVVVTGATPATVAYGVAANSPACAKAATRSSD
jgi:hypothetical protein